MSTSSVLDREYLQSTSSVCQGIRCTVNANIVFFILKTCIFVICIYFCMHLLYFVIFFIVFLNILFVDILKCRILAGKVSSWTLFQLNFFLYIYFYIEADNIGLNSFHYTTQLFPVTAATTSTLTQSFSINSCQSGSRPS